MLPSTTDDASGVFSVGAETLRATSTRLRAELTPFFCNESSSQGRCADYRAGHRLQKVKRLSHPKAFAFEIGRIGRSCLEEDPLKLGMHFANATMEFLSQGRSWF